MNSEVYRRFLCSPIQPNASKLIRRYLTIRQDPKHTAKATKKFFEVKHWNLFDFESLNLGLYLLKRYISMKVPFMLMYTVPILMKEFLHIKELMLTKQLKMTFYD